MKPIWPAMVTQALAAPPRPHSRRRAGMAAVPESHVPAARSTARDTTPRARSARAGLGAAVSAPIGRRASQRRRRASIAGWGGSLVRALPEGGAAGAAPRLTGFTEGLKLSLGLAGGPP